MPYSDIEIRKQKNKEYSRRYYEKNKKKVQEATNKVRRAGRAVFKEFKARLSCIQCGENHPATLDFHHHTPHPDNIKISKLLADGRFSFAIEEIMNKCVVLCSNCHRKHHYEERKKGRA
jgi:hypothetical protein